MAIIIAIIEIVIRALLPALAAGATPTAQDGARQPELRRRLVERIRGHWGAALLLVGILALSGCNRTIYVPSGEPVRLRETVRSVKVWVLDMDGKPIPSVMDLPEGGYYLADPGAQAPSPKPQAPEF